MRLYVYCHSCGNRIYINSSAQNRNELPFNFYLRCPQFNCSAHIQDVVYSRSEVRAETGQNGAFSGAIVLGALGALAGGPAGALIGGLIGAVAGSNADQTDGVAVERFNNS